MEENNLCFYHLLSSMSRPESFADNKQIEYDGVEEINDVKFAKYDNKMNFMGIRADFIYYHMGEEELHGPPLTNVGDTGNAVYGVLAVDNKGKKVKVDNDFPYVHENKEV